jgi:hypothetical protein
LFVSDGNDEGSDLALPQLMEHLGADITVDAIGFGAGAASASGSLSTVARATRGRFVAAASTSDLQASMGALLKPPASGSALHTVKVSVHASIDAKCLQLAYGVAVDSLQDVSATTTLVSGRLGVVNLSINCVALGAGQSAVALVTAAGGTALAATQAGDSIAAKLAAAAN